MAEDNIDKALPNEPRKKFNIPGEEEIREQVVEEVQVEQESPGPVDIQENEDGSVDINLDPNAASPEGGDEHYANLADFLPDDVLGRMASALSSKVSRICFIKKRLGKNLHTRFRFTRFQIRSKNRTI
jgi:hypothetical protein